MLASSLHGSHDWTQIPMNKDSQGHTGEIQMCPLGQGSDEHLVLCSLLCRFWGPFYCYRERAQITRWQMHILKRSWNPSAENYLTMWQSSSIT